MLCMRHFARRARPAQRVDAWSAQREDAVVKSVNTDQPAELGDVGTCAGGVFAAEGHAIRSELPILVPKSRDPCPNSSTFCLILLA